MASRRGATRTPRRGLLQDRAYGQIKDRIQDGTFPPGTFLSERMLARELGMSKTPIRSALGRLEFEGFVRVSPQQGIVVREPAIQEIIDTFDLRAALETYVVRRLAGGLTAAQVARIRRNLREQNEAVRKGNTLRFIEKDVDFHVLLCELLGNREIGRIMNQLREKTHRIILRQLKQVGARARDAAAEHAAIAEAVIKGRGEVAARRVLEHLSFGRRFMMTGGDA